MRKNLKNFTFIALAAIVIASCSKTKESPAAPDPQTEKSEKVLSYIQSLGFPASAIVENGDHYVVEEDIIFPKNMVIPAGQPKTEQYYTGSLVNATNKRNIRVKVDASMTSMNAEVTSAVNQWNGIAGSTVKFSIVTSGTYDILIKDENLGNGVCGQGTFPSGGAAGNLIKINKAYIAANSFAQRQRTITHELGHNISLRHTNWSAIGEGTATPVPGVGGTDAASLMNGGQCNSGATVLSTKDKQATVALYP
ncbi:M57 family metalloprotease [Pedobacter cryoconitis]|uniref:Dual-action HEIGH metallo-peptidase n=1 Tax=Pedobacter cryoconitis TaxID=188932 RepID=A0A327T8I0_9SPHI|nr:M57 family metalloprotease [Pedobacter cryoconitis]RAJ37232.1 dual-action HEIGH metallo-peptidase [Pedobacter cryoconitis]